jgi:hypothetical protein
MRGMASRLCRRLNTMKAAQHQSTHDNPRQIVLVKEQILEQALKANHITIQTVGERIIRFDTGAYADGAIAGDRVTIASGALE